MKLLLSSSRIDVVMMHYFKVVLLFFLVVFVVILEGVYYRLSLMSQAKIYPEARAFGLESQLSFDEMESFLESLAQEKGAVYAFEVLKQATLPPNVDTHLLGHAVGDVLYQQEGVAGITKCTQDFRNACSHTIVIGLFQDFGLDALPQIAEACHQAPGGKGAYTMCFHGLGHGVLAYTGYDFRKAVSLCQEVGTEEFGHRESSECVGGAMMEMVAGVHDRDLWQLQAEKLFLEQDPLFPCNADYIPERDRFACIAYQTPHLFRSVGGDLGKPTASTFEAAFKHCQGWESPKFKDFCYASFGKEFIVLARQRDIRDFNKMTNEEMQQVEVWCQLAPEESGIEACLVSAVSSLYWGGENDVRIALRFCGQVSDRHKPACFRTVIGAVNYYATNPEYKQKVCDEVPSELTNECRAVLLGQ